MSVESIQKLLLQLCCVIVPFCGGAQWSNGTVVELNNSHQNKSVFVGDADAGFLNAKFHVKANPDTYANDVLVKMEASTMSSSNSTILLLQGSAFPDGNPTILEGTNVGGGELFKFRYDGVQQLRGKLNLKRDGVAGRLLEANGNETIWFDGSQYSWGFGGDWNRFADPISIGSDGQPSSRAALRIGNGKDIEFMGNGPHRISFYDPAGDNVISTIESTLNVLRLDDVRRLRFDVGGNEKMSITSFETVMNQNLTMNAPAILWKDSSNNNAAAVAYESNTIGLVGIEDNVEIALKTIGGEISFNNGEAEISMVNSNVGIYVKDPQHALHVDGDVGVTGEFYALSDRRLKKNIEHWDSGHLVDIVSIRPAQYEWREKADEKISIGVIAQELKEIFPEAIKETSDGYLQVNYNVLAVVAIQGIKELNAKIEEQADQIKRQEELLTQILEKINLVSEDQVNMVSGR